MLDTVGGGGVGRGEGDGRESGARGVEAGTLGRGGGGGV